MFQLLVALLQAVGGPDVTVVSDNEQIKIARSPGNRGYLLRVAVKHRLPGKRAPVSVPASGATPGRGPDVTIAASDATIVSDDEQVKMVRSPGNHCDMLRVTVKHRLPRKRTPVSVPIVSGAAPGRGRECRFR